MNYKAGVPTSLGGRGETKDSRRILMVAPQPFYQDRGTPIALRRLLEALAEQGQEVDLLTYSIGESIKLPGLRTFRVGTCLPIRNVPIGLSFKKAVLDVLLFFAMIRMIRRTPYRCIHAVEEAAFLAVLFRRKHKIPVVYDMQSSLPEHLLNYSFFRTAAVQYLLRSIETRLIRSVDLIICSAGLRNYILEIDPTAKVHEWYFPGEPITVSSGEVTRLREEFAIEPETRIVLYTGNFEPYQELSRILAAAPMILDVVPNTVFMLVGMEASSDMALTRSWNTLLGQGVLRFVPRQPKDKIFRFLAMADVVVSPRASGSNIALKIFDYLAAGKPIVAADSPAHRALLNEERAVLIQNTPEELSRAIVRLLQDPNESRRLGESAKAYAQKYLSRSAFTSRVAELYNLEGLPALQNPKAVFDGRPI